MAVNAEESIAGSSFPSSQRWSRRKLLYPENKGLSHYFGGRASVFKLFHFIVLEVSLAVNAGNFNEFSLIIHYFRPIIKRTISTICLD